MPKSLLYTLSLLLHLVAAAQPAPTYRSLDAEHPILFDGRQVVYGGETITLGPKAFFIDGQLPDSVVAQLPFVFNSVQAAAAQLTPGTEAAPMVLYLAPWVYWIDNPDDTAVRVPKEGNTPYGMVINCPWLRFEGLNPNPANVVLASNRGQTIGAMGNFTMFRFIGDGTRSENITFGNYCNVDLVYPLKPALGRPKRAQAIVQAQLIHCNGDKIVARNTRFISRLNLCPFTGGKRVLFDRCHFESTDDALCGTGVYLHSTLDFYSSKPFYNTTGTGAVFLDCDIRSMAGRSQFFTKAGGQVAVVDSRFTTEGITNWAWQDVAPPALRNYQAHVLANGRPLFIGQATAANTVDMTGKPVLNAYRFTHNGNTVYNTYNLLSGNDEWDPMNVRDLVTTAATTTGKTYNNLPVQLLVTPGDAFIESKKNEVTLEAKAVRFGNYAAEAGPVQWAVAPKDRALVQLKPVGDGARCVVVPTNTQNETRQVVVTASTESGLQGAVVVTVSPQILAAPGFKVQPVLLPAKGGVVQLRYQLATAFPDQSDVRWYRCTNALGANAIETAVSRFNEPLRSYVLSSADVGYYLMATISPGHIRSQTGPLVRVLTARAIAASDINMPAGVLETDFRNVSVKNQPKLLPGFWSFGHIAPKYRDGKYNVDTTRDAWFVGEGADGAAGMTGLLQGREGSMRYIPVGETFGDLELTLNLSPFKTAGQGFSVAHLYMDVLIKFDAHTGTGYALRLVRTTQYHDAVVCMLMRYENGTATPVSEAVPTSAFRAPCTIGVAVTGNRLSAWVTTSAPAPERARPEVTQQVRLESTVVPGTRGGIGIEYNGGSPTMINKLRAVWK